MSTTSASPPSSASSELRVRVARKATEALDICSLDLVAESGSLPPFSAGAHIDVHLPILMSHNKDLTV